MRNGFEALFPPTFGKLKVGFDNESREGVGASGEMGYWKPIISYNQISEYGYAECYNTIPARRDFLYNGFSGNMFVYVTWL